jgi:hypothetical protein
MRKTHSESPLDGSSQEAAFIIQGSCKWCLEMAVLASGVRRWLLGF